MPDTSLKLSAGEVAYLAGEEQQVLAVALANLTRSGLIIVDGQERRVCVSGKGPTPTDPLEVALFSAINPETGTLISELQSAVSPPMAPIKSRLQELGLLVATDQAFLVRLIPTTLVLAVVILGVIKICIGLSGDKSVGWLFLLTELGVIALLFFASPMHRSRRGDRILARLQRRHSAMELCLQTNSDSLFRADLSWAIALFGLGIVTSGPLADLKMAMQLSGGSGGGGEGDGGGGGCGGCGG